MKRPFSLVGENVSQDTVQVLEELLRKAKRGEMLGVVLVAIQKPRGYEFFITGEASRSPTFTLGTVAKLQELLAKRVEVG